MANLISFTEFQAIAFTLVASLFLYMTLGLLRYIVKEMKKP